MKKESAWQRLKRLLRNSRKPWSERLKEIWPEFDIKRKGEGNEK